MRDVGESFAEAFFTMALKTQPLTNSPAARRGHAQSIVANLLEAGYRVVQTIGQGSAGTIFQARSHAGELVAIKVLHPRLAGDAVSVKRFLREGGVCAHLNHPNLVRSLGAGEKNGTYYLVMEYVPGETLGALFERRSRLTEDEAVPIILSLALALKVIHDAQLVHRDVKPSNVLMTADGAPKLGDLGLAKELVASDLTRPNQSLGTPIFMAPEQFFNAQQVDGRCDIYALGIMLYALTTGELPFPGPELGRILDNKINGNFIPPERINPNLSAPTIEAIRRSIQPRPENRPTTIDEFIELLAKAPAGPRRAAVEVKPIAEQAEPLVGIRTAANRIELPEKFERGSSGVRDVRDWQASEPIPVAFPSESPSRFAQGSSTPPGAIGATPSDVSIDDAGIDRWHLVLAKGRSLKLVQASAAAIVRAILKGKLQVNVCASRSERGPFTPIGMIPDLMKLLPAE